MRAIDAEGSELQTQLKIIREAEYQIYGSGSWGFTAKCERAIEDAPTIQPEIVRCKDCQYWNKGSCECPEHAVNCQDYYVGDIETEAEYFCGYAKRKEETT